MLRRFAQAGAHSASSLLKESRPSLAPRLPIAAPSSFRLSTPFATFSTGSVEPISSPRWYFVINLPDNIVPVARSIDFKRGSFPYWPTYMKLIHGEQLERATSCEFQAEIDGISKKVLEVDARTGKLLIFDQELAKEVFEEFKLEFVRNVESNPGVERYERRLALFSSEIDERLASCEIVDSGPELVF